MTGTLNIAVLASGRGSNLKAILDAVRSGTIRRARVSLVISNNPDAGALQIARVNGIASLHLSRQQFESDEAFNTALLSALTRHGVNFIALAGYLKKIHSSIIQAYRNRIINVHPALLPAFGGPGMYGKFVHEAVIKSGAAISGATVHVVDEQYDHGAIILQKSVPVAPDDTPETLAARVSAIEHEIYPEAIRLFAEGKVKIEEQHVEIESHV